MFVDGGVGGEEGVRGGGGSLPVQEALYLVWEVIMYN